VSKTTFFTEKHKCYPMTLIELNHMHIPQCYISKEN